MKLVSVAPVYFIFNRYPLFCTTAFLRAVFLTPCVGASVFMRGSPAASRAQRMEPGPTFVTLLPCHAGSTCALSRRIALQAHRTWRRKRERRKEKRMKFHQKPSESIKGWTRKWINHYSFGRDNRIAVIEFLHGLQMLAQNNPTRSENKGERQENRALMESALTFYQYNGL